jgi:hypothetical protein
MTTKHKDDYAWLNQHLKKHHGKGDVETMQLPSGQINAKLVPTSDIIVINNHKEQIKEYQSK